MAEQTFDRRNSLILFRNNRKREDKNDPDLTGTYTDGNGVEHWLSVWPKTNRETGEKFWTGSTKPKQAQASRPAPRASRPADDDLP